MSRQVTQNFYLFSITTCAIRNILTFKKDSGNYMYSRIASTKYPSFCVTTFSASLTHLKVLLPQSRDCSCYVSRPIMPSPPLWLRKQTALRAHDLAHSHDLWHQPRLANVTCSFSWRLCGINPAVPSALVLRLFAFCPHSGLLCLTLVSQ
jgi:hypothetical protein